MADAPIAQKLPPQNVEAERALIGAVFLENFILNRVLEYLSAQDFYRESHRKIFSAMVELWEKNEPVDIITVAEKLKYKDQLAAVGGVASLAELSDSAITAAGAVTYSKIIRDKARMRALISAVTDILGEAYQDRDDVDLFLDDAERRVFEISEARIRPSFVTMKEIVKESFKTIEELYERKEQITGVPTGFVDLDRLTGGFQPAELIVVAGRPGMGKTSLCLNVAAYAAIEAQLPVAVFSLEMSKEQLALRMLCSQAKVDAQRVRSGFLTEGDWPKLTRAAGALSEAPIYIDDTAAINVLELRAKARRWRVEHNLGLIIIDYLQLMRGRREAERRELEVSEMSRSLKALAKELNLPVVVLSQLNRAVEQREDKRPQLANLRESGAIEQDADLILFLYREAFYNREYTEEADKAEVIIGKQRNGPTGTVNLTFLRKFARFENCEGIHSALGAE